jgi:hypothetical protein
MHGYPPAVGRMNLSQISIALSKRRELEDDCLQ